MIYFSTLVSSPLSVVTMAKQSKRTRKFNSSGGVKGRLQKGTITNKGKVKRKGTKRAKTTQDDGDKHDSSKKVSSYSQELKQKRDDADFMSKKNLGDMDMDSFFESFAESPESDNEEMEEPEIEEDEGDDEDQDMESDDDDEEEDDEEEDESNDDVEKVTPQQRKKTVAKPVKKAKLQDKDSEEDSDSDEEDVEEAERKMKAEMGKLREKDPEFHQFLEENDENLLEYGEQGDDDDDDDDDESEQGDEDDNEDDAANEENETMGDAESNAAKDSSVQLTESVLAKMEKGCFQMHGIKALKKFVGAFKSACYLADAEDDKAKKFRGKKYHIESSAVFDRLMVLSLTRVHDEIYHHLFGAGSKKTKGPQDKKPSQSKDENEAEEELKVEPNKPINPKLLEKATRWTDVKPILLSFFQATMHILSEAKEPGMVVFVLKSLADYLPYMTPYPGQAEVLLKVLTNLWSAPIDASEDYQVVRLHAFLRIRQLALTQPFPFIETCLKKLYLAYAQRAKFATASSVTSALPTLTFMGNCVVELYSLDYHSSYQHAFIYIRQLALHLRTAMQKKTSEAIGAVYCWQYLHCLKLWVAVLTAACQSKNDLSSSSNNNSNGSGDQLLQSLLFPLSQVILGTVRLVPSTRYLPLRLHCVRLLQQLAASAEVFLPTTSILLDAFDLKELSQPPQKKVKKSSVHQPLALTFRLGADNALRTMEEMEMCVSEVFVLLNREIDLYQYSAGFPEFSVRICQRLRKVCIYEMKKGSVYCLLPMMVVFLKHFDKFCCFYLFYIVFQRNTICTMESLCQGLYRSM